MIDDIENVEYFNIKYFINKFVDIDDHEKAYLQYSIESFGKTYGLFENTLNSDEWFKLTPKGIDLKEYGKGFNKFEKKLKRNIDWYKIIGIILTFVFGCSTIYFSILSYDLKESQSDVTIQNESLKAQTDSLKVENARLLNLVDSLSSESNSLIDRL